MFLFALYHYVTAGIVTEEVTDLELLITLACLADFAIVMTLAKALVLYIGGKLK